MALEDRLRNLILTNAAQQPGGLDTARQAAHPQVHGNRSINASTDGAIEAPRSGKRPNQNQRRQSHNNRIQLDHNNYQQPSPGYDVTRSTHQGIYQRQYSPSLGYQSPRGPNPHFRHPQSPSVRHITNTANAGPQSPAYSAMSADQPRQGNRQPHVGVSHRTPYHSRFSFQQGSPRPQPHQLKYVSDMIDSIVPTVQVTPQEMEMNDRFRIRLQDAVRAIVTEHNQTMGDASKPSQAELRCYGSLASGFATRGSDMDLLIVPGPGEPELDLYSLPRAIEAWLLANGIGARLLTRTRIPIIKVCEKPSETLLEALRAARQKVDVQRIEAEAKKQSPEIQAKPKETDPGSMAEVSEVDLAVKDQDQSAALEGQKAEQDASNPENGTAEKPVQTRPHGNEGKSDEELLRLYLLAFAEGWYEPKEREVILYFQQVYHNCLYGKPHQDELDRARAALRDLPDVLVRYKEPKKDILEFPKTGVGCQCDINFSNALAIHNTKLLRCYSLCDPRILPMVLFIKAFVKRRDINSPYHGQLSSYGYVLMVLHFLVNVVEPAVLPNLQLLNRNYIPDLASETGEYMGCNVRFWNDEKDILACSQAGTITQNSMSVAELVVRFFEYYGDTRGGPRGPGFQWTSQVISLRTPGGILTKEEKGWTGWKNVQVDGRVSPERTVHVQSHYLLAIEDPFELDHNVARTVYHDGIVAIRDEFRRAITLIRNGGALRGAPPEDLFAEGQDHSRKFKYFGKKPRPGAKTEGDGGSGVKIRHFASGKSG